MNQPRARARLGLALCAAVSVIGLSAVQVSAKDNDPDPGVRCAAKVGPGQYEFYLPGERATDVNGNHWVCGPDGQWFRDYSGQIIKNPTVKAAALGTPTGTVSASVVIGK